MLPFKGDNGDLVLALDPWPHSAIFGVLTPVLEKVIPQLSTIRLTIVGLNPDSGPALGVVDTTYTPETEAVDPEDEEVDWMLWDEVELNHWDELCESLKTQFMDKVADKVLEYHGPEGEDLLANVRFMDREAWEAEARASGEPCDMTVGRTL
jgi:hypothetical protein